MSDENLSNTTTLRTETKEREREVFPGFTLYGASAGVVGRFGQLQVKRSESGTKVGGLTPIERMVPHRSLAPSECRPRVEGEPLSLGL